MSKQDGVDPIGVIIVVGLIWLLILVAVAFMWYGQEPYQVNKARDWIDRAKATNDLKDMAKYVNTSLAILEPYHGNPKWWFPTPDTDLDLIKDNMKEVIRNCEQSSGIQDDFAYQQAVHNLQDTLLQIRSHIADASMWIFIQPWGVFLISGLVWIPFLSAGLVARR